MAMLKNFALAAPLLLTLTASLPSTVMAEPHNYTGRVIARTATSISVFDKEIVTIPTDDRTTVVRWIRTTPFVRRTAYLTAAAVTPGSLVTIRTRDEGNVAKVIQVANDVKQWFNGRVVAYTDTSMSVFDKEMAVVTLATDNRTTFTRLFTVKPWVRKTEHLSRSDLKVGSFVNLFPSKADPQVAGRVEIATDMTLFAPPALPSN
jgi:hypothetical protein